MPPAAPRWLRIVKDVRNARLRRAMHRPFVMTRRRLFSGMACHCQKESSVSMSQNMMLDAVKIYGSENMLLYVDSPS